MFYLPKMLLSSKLKKIEISYLHLKSLATIINKHVIFRMSKKPIPSILIPNNSIYDDNPIYTHTIYSSLLSSNSSYSLGSLLYIDFNFYNIISIYSYAFVLDMIYTSTAYLFTFPTCVKCSPVSIFL